MVSTDFWRGRRVFLTGHTGFKGAWLALWLQRMGAQVTGYALAAPTHPNLHGVAGVGATLQAHEADLRDLPRLQHALQQSGAEVVLHLAAQAIVRTGYTAPLDTFSTNVNGTLHLLEAARNCPQLRSVVVVTSDKCYENRESGHAYREGDPLGGKDPYSASKACTELVTHAYRQSYLAELGVGVATARAGNVFGGGDWSPDRLVPDLLEAFATQRPARLRAPNAVRPWQHVLEPLAGYLQLAERLHATPDTLPCWNFGPPLDDCLSTGELATRFAHQWGEAATWESSAVDFPCEAGLLHIDARQALAKLGWQPMLGLPNAIRLTVEWHRAWLAGQNMRAVTEAQIDHYQDLLNQHAH